MGSAWTSAVGSPGAAAAGVHHPFSRLGFQTPQALMLHNPAAAATSAMVLPHSRAAMHQPAHLMPWMELPSPGALPPTPKPQLQPHTWRLEGIHEQQHHTTHVVAFAASDSGSSIYSSSSSGSGAAQPVQPVHLGAALAGDGGCQPPKLDVGANAALPTKPMQQQQQQPTVLQLASLPFLVYTAPGGWRDWSIIALLIAVAAPSIAILLLVSWGISQEQPDLYFEGTIVIEVPVER